MHLTGRMVDRVVGVRDVDQGDGLGPIRQTEVFDDAAQHFIDDLSHHRTPGGVVVRQIDRRVLQLLVTLQGVLEVAVPGGGVQRDFLAQQESDAAAPLLDVMAKRVANRLCQRGLVFVGQCGFGAHPNLGICSEQWVSSLSK